MSSAGLSVYLAKLAFNELPIAAADKAHLKMARTALREFKRKHSAARGNIRVAVVTVHTASSEYVGIGFFGTLPPELHPAIDQLKPRLQQEIPHFVCSVTGLFPDVHTRSSLVTVVDPVGYNYGRTIIPDTNVARRLLGSYIKGDVEGNGPNHVRTRIR